MCSMYTCVWKWKEKRWRALRYARAAGFNYIFHLDSLLHTIIIYMYVYILAPSFSPLGAAIHESFCTRNVIIPLPNVNPLTRKSLLHSFLLYLYNFSPAPSIITLLQVHLRLVRFFAAWPGALLTRVTSSNLLTIARTTRAVGLYTLF